ncbi:transposase [Oscillospiraceae bacterium 50-60]
MNFVAAFPHCECVCGLSEKAFAAKYQKRCKKHSYNFSQNKALDIYASACGHFSVMPKTDTAKLPVEQAVSQLRAVSTALAALRNEMQSLAASLPESTVVMGMFGVGPTLGPQLMAEIGDVRRFPLKRRWQPLRALTPCRTSPARWKYTAAASPNVAPPPCAGRCSW